MAAGSGLISSLTVEVPAGSGLFSSLTVYEPEQKNREWDVSRPLPSLYDCTSSRLSSQHGSTFQS